MDTFPLTLPCSRILNAPPIIFVCFFLHLLFSSEERVTVFTKPAVTRDLFDVQTSAEVCWKDNELLNTCALLEFQ